MLGMRKKEIHFKMSVEFHPKFTGCLVILLISNTGEKAAGEVRG